jgi:hypothetical protein
MNDSSHISLLPGWHRWLVLAAIVVVGAIYTRGTFDFSRFDDRFLLPVWFVFLGSLGIVFANLVAAFRASQSTFTAGPWSRSALAAAIPVAFLAAGLDCTGASLSGCSPVCGFLVRIWTPAVAVAAAAYVITGRRWLLPVITVMCFPYMVPNCLCYNPLNAWWLHRFPLSPACFAASGWASLIAIVTLSWGRLVPLAVAACWLVNAVLLGFFVGHHYYHFPW